jgi:hypothetical protein
VSYIRRVTEYAVEAARVTYLAYPKTRGKNSSADAFRAALEAAAPHMLIHVHHHDIEHHARSFNDGYEAAVTQGLADDPTLADDWFQEKVREAKAEAWDEGQGAGWNDCLLDLQNGGAKATSNPYRAERAGE